MPSPGVSPRRRCRISLPRGNGPALGAHYRTRVNEGHIGWADLIFVMEKKHRRILEKNFPEALNGKQILCLHLPDVYHYMEPALIADLKAAISQHIELPESA